MVKIQKQIISFFRLIQLYTEQSFLHKLIRTHQFFPVQPVVYFHLKRRIIVSFLPNITFFIHK